MSCENCGREIKNYGVFLGGVRCPNYCGLKQKSEDEILIEIFGKSPKPIDKRKK